MRVRTPAHHVISSTQLGSVLQLLLAEEENPEDFFKERTIACNLGLALDDMATAPLIYQRALEKGIGTWLAL